MHDIDQGSLLRDPLENNLGYQLRRASAVMMADLAASLAPTELRPAEATILLVIRANAGSTQSDVGRLLGIKRANMVPLISGLLEANLIERSRMDGRSHALSLTNTGTAMAERVAALIEAHEARFQAALEPTLAREVLLGSLQAIRNVQADD